MTAEEEYERLIAALPYGAKVVAKKGWFWTTLHYVVLVVTLGGNREFLKRYATTIGPIIAVPEGWEKRPALSRLSLVVHELHHVRQAKMAGLWISPWLGMVPMGIAYLLLPLPIGLAWCRYVIERSAYLVGIRVKVKYGMDYAPLIEHAVGQLTTGAYGWTWPFPSCVRAWFLKRLT